MANLVRKVFFRVKSKIRRVNSIRHAYDYPAENNGWKKYGVPLLGGKTQGTYFDPYVREWDHTFVMFSSFRNGASIVRCESRDGIAWTKPVEVLKGTGKMDWENIVNRASVIRVSGVWYMWYTGQDQYSSRIGLATSNDGIHFERCAQNPVLVPEQACEQQSVMNPCVLWNEAEHVFQMWYSAGQKYEPDVICYATSKDGIHWSKYPANPILSRGTEAYDCAKIGGCDILKEKHGYLMFYIGYQNIDNARICVARSEDGIVWKREAGNPILAPSKGKWDAHAVYKPTVCYRENEKKWYLWYNGRKENDEFIGMAWKDERE